MKKVVVNKGYTLEVVSWENDSDSYKTKYKTVSTETEARAIVKICKELFEVLGNSMDGEWDSIIEEYIKENPELELTRDKIYNLAYDLMVGPEWYDFRVCESVTVTFSPENIEVEVITF